MDDPTNPAGLVDLLLEVGKQWGTGAVLFTIMAGLYVKFVRPDQLKRDSARESLITTMMDNWRADQADRNKEYLDREQRMRDAYTKQLHEQEERHLRDNETLRSIFGDVVKALDANTAATRQNGVLIFSLAGELNIDKRTLADKATRLAGTPIDKSIYETKDNIG